MATYYVDFKNQTNQTWTLAVYQTLPNSEGLDSVSWKQTTVPPNGESSVSWDVTYDVAIAGYSQEGGIGVYSANQTQPTNLGTVWDCVWLDGVQQLVPDQTSTPVPGQILIKNSSDQLANLGIGMSGQGAVFKQGVDSGANAQFVVSPTYYAGLFDDVQLGQVISSDVATDPQTLVFPSGLDYATITATLNNGVLTVSIGYKHATDADIVRIKRTAAASKALGRAA